MITIDDIQAAHDRIRDQVTDTPCLHSRTLSAIAQCRLHLKFENLQFTASFKERGAANRLLTLNPDQTSRGVIAVSAGNHAQGVSYHCQRLGIPATIVMPRFTPFVKVENTERFGAKVVLEGDTLAQARIKMLELAQAGGMTVVHPYDDPAVIAGQGTIALEMLRVVPDLDTLVVAVGGGGLISGIAIAAKAIKPDIRIVGVQADHFPAATHMWLTDRPGQTTATIEPSELVVPGGPTLAEGIAVEEPGSQTMPIINELVDDMLLVTEAQVEQAILSLLDIEKTVVEGAGAAGLAAVMAYRDRFAGQRVGLVLCGGNIDSLTLSDIVQRQLALSHRLVRLMVTAPDSPGSLARIARIVGELGANIEQVSHQRVFADLPVRYVKVELTLSTRGDAHLQRVISALDDDNLRTSLLN
ncbi:MAG: threonine ammonia-lyase [Burkholderiaceae bacterium]